MKRLWLKFSATFGQSIIHPQYIVKDIEYQSIRFAKKYARGKLLDIGCGNMPYKKELLEVVDQYVGLDYPTTKKMYPGSEKPDVLGDAKSLPFKDKSFDSVILLQVLEHIDEPTKAISEAHRVLKNKGILIISIPFMYPLHDTPHDYTRFTEYALKKMLGTRFRIKEFSKDGTFLDFWLQSLLLFLLFRGKYLLERKSVLSKTFGVAILATSFPLGVICNLISVLMRLVISKTSALPNIFPLNYTIVLKKQ